MSPASPAGRPRRPAVVRTLACGAVALLAACAAGPETQRARAETQSVELAQTPFFPQERYQCGPAALATVLQASGVDVLPPALVPQVYIPQREGSLQSEMIAAARRYGRVPYLLDPHVGAVLAELHAGRPVLVFQNLGLRSLPVWHYAVVIGYDAAADRFILRSGRQRRALESDKDWLARWHRGGRWTLVTVAPDELPASADAQRWLQAVAPFESLGRLELARTAYETALRRWPDEALLWAALGNVRYAQGDRPAAARAYAKALELDAGAALVRNNYAQTLAELGCAGRARQELARAEAAAEDDERAVLAQTRTDISRLPPAQCPL